MNDRFDNLPPDLAPTAEALDRLAHADRESAPADLTLRLARATWPALRGQVKREPAQSHRRVWIRRQFVAAAAMVALVSGVIVIGWMAGPRPADDDFFYDNANDFDLLLTLTADDGAFRGEVDLLKADTAALQAELESRLDTWAMLDVEGAL